MKEVSIKYASLFAGMGGFDLGLERSGMQCVQQVEIDKWCRTVLRHHYPHVMRTKDVRKVKIEEGHIGLLCGGFPCQDLSVAGRRTGLAGKRSGLFFEFTRIAQESRPRWVLLENVPGLLSNNKGWDMGTVLGTLGQLGYWWSYRVLDAQYFGLAQRRKRVFIVGHLADRTAAAQVLFDSEGMSGSAPPSRKTGAATAASLTAGSTTSRGVNYPGRQREDDVNLVARCDTTGHGKRYDYETDDFVIATTIRSRDQSRGVDSDCTDTLIQGAYGVRRLTPLECLRLQGFPDDWLNLDPPLSDSVKYRMTGNAVAVPVIEWIGRRIMEVNKGER